MTQIIDGKKISQEIKDELREQVAEQKKAWKRSGACSDPGRNRSGFQRVCQ